MECAPPHRQRPTLPGDFACLNPAQRAAVKILTKYNAAHWLGQSEKKGVALLTLPGDIAPLFRPQGAGGRYPNQVHSLTSLETTWERDVADEMKKNPPHKG